MTSALIFALSLTGDGKPEPEQIPLVLSRSMEIEDLDRGDPKTPRLRVDEESSLPNFAKSSPNGLVSRGDLERQEFDYKYEEAREAESVAFRALKAYERDVFSRATAADARRAFGLLLDWVRKQVAIARVEMDYRALLTKQSRTLFSRGVMSRQELEDGELAFNLSEASYALNRSREAQVLMEIAGLNTDKPEEAAEFHGSSRNTSSHGSNTWRFPRKGPRADWRSPGNVQGSASYPPTSFGLFQKGGRRGEHYSGLRAEIAREPRGGTPGRQAQGQTARRFLTPCGHKSTRITLFPNPTSCPGRLFVAQRRASTGFWRSPPMRVPVWRRLSLSLLVLGIALSSVPESRTGRPGVERGLEAGPGQSLSGHRDHPP